MLPINDTLDAIFLGTFLFGLLFALASFVLGAVDLDLGGESGDAGADANGNGSGWSGVVNVSTVLAFVAWFGGVGYLARNSFGWVAPVAIAVGVVGGLVGGYAVYLFFKKVIAPSDRAMDPRDYELPGTIARVSSSIRAGGTGEIVYEQAGYRQVGAARSLDGSPLDRGSEVVIMEIRAGVAFVQTWATLMEGSIDDPALLSESAERDFEATLQAAELAEDDLVVDRPAEGAPRDDGMLHDQEVLPETSASGRDQST